MCLLVGDWLWIVTAVWWGLGNLVPVVVFVGGFSWFLVGRTMDGNLVLLYFQVLVQFCQLHGCNSLNLTNVDSVHHKPWSVGGATDWATSDLRFVGCGLLTRGSVGLGSVVIHVAYFRWQRQVEPFPSISSLLQSYLPTY